MAESLIAIVGSADPHREDYNPPLQQLDVIPGAAEQLGKELAEANCRIVVYSSNPTFIEASVVRGYVRSGKAAARSIEVRYPQKNDDGNLPFPEETEKPDIFDFRLDPNPNWEVSFYTSLHDVDGIILLGGARSAFVTGVLAQIFGIPLVTIATFGGSAQAVWTLAGNRFASEEERNLMARRSWHADSAAKLVKSLSDQAKRRADQIAQAAREQQRRRGEGQKRAIIAGGLFLVAVALMATGMFLPRSQALTFGATFFLIPLLSGAAGALVRTILNQRQGSISREDDSPVISIVLGMIAGLASALLFALAQWAINPPSRDFTKGVPEGLSNLLPFLLIIGLTGGLTLELVYRKLQEAKISSTHPIETGGLEGR